MRVCIPTYMLASGLIAGGMSWKQAIGTILLGNLIVLIPMILNAHAGTKYGIPFPVYVRASFGVRGANIPAVLRALVASSAREPEQVQDDWRVPSFFCAVANRDGWLLGYGGVEHSGLHPLCEVATRADGGAGLGFAYCDDRLLVYRCRGDLRFGCDLWNGDMGSGGAAWKISGAGDCFDCAGCVADRYAQYQRCGECGFALERFLQSESAADLFSHGRIDHGGHRCNNDAVEAAVGFQQLHLRLAGGLLGLAGADCGHHDCRLLYRSEEHAGC